MSAPYPHPNPIPGSNAIGRFRVGISQIGDIIPFDVWLTILSQYGNSPIITQLCTNMQDYIDQTQNFSEFFDSIWNVDTAIGYGLDVWGAIVGVGRVLNVANTKYFGFSEQGAATVDPFGQSPFWSGENLTSNFTLSDSAYRTLIFAKALANICDGSIPALNQLLINLFPNRGNAYVTDGNNLTMTYTFAFALTPVEAAIVVASGVLPNTAGVALSIVQLF